ncbi:unnamed protein product [Polarella glacialis]|uniref:Uncharacterized protein n=1 Tax=Polarella glacialis TaxID=89957 RepID=A0A813FJZ9_POLGL|nr:unnamed protein product [Polarella glacialis]CAE8612782.1 unnamed protein product [Polarella glacialis]
MPGAAAAGLERSAGSQTKPQELSNRAWARATARRLGEELMDAAAVALADSKDAIKDASRQNPANAGWRHARPGYKQQPPAGGAEREMQAGADEGDMPPQESANSA